MLRILHSIYQTNASQISIYQSVIHWVVFNEYNTYAFENSTECDPVEMAIKAF